MDRINEHINDASPLALTVLFAVISFILTVVR